MPVAANLAIVETLKARFDCKVPIVCVHGREPPSNLPMLQEVLHLPCLASTTDARACPHCSPVMLVTPERLRCCPTTGRLLVADQPTTVVVSQCILEMHQDELAALPEEILEELMRLSKAGRCLNPLPTILLAHDKRALHILPRLSASELPDASARAVLRRHIIPTTPVHERTALAAAAHSLRSVLPASTPLVLKQAKLGKGKGMLLEHDFPSFDAFLDAAQANMHGPVVLQPYVTQATREIALPRPQLSAPLTTARQTAVGSLLCLDGRFLGPALFRTSPDPDRIALNTGGIMVAPAMSLGAELPPQAQFFAPTTLEELAAGGAPGTPPAALGASLRKALCENGAALLSCGGGVGDGETLAGFLQSVLGAELRNHSPTRGPVWEVRPMPGADLATAARSHTRRAFPVHTDASYERKPPRFFALAIAHADHEGGGYLGLANVAQAVESGLTAAEAAVLRRVPVAWRIPPEFGGGPDEHGRPRCIFAPVLMSNTRARLRRDIMSTEHLPEDEARLFWAAFDRLYTLLQDTCNRNQRLLPERSVIILDNERLVHARNSVLDPKRVLFRVRFDLPDTPEVTRILAHAQPTTIDDSAWLSTLATFPTTTKAQLLARIERRFFSLLASPTSSDAAAGGGGRAGAGHASHPLHGLYFSPSGGTSTGSVGAERCVVPAAVEENAELRRQFARLAADLGAVDANTVCLNLYAAGNLYRSLEVHGDLIVANGGTNLPIGAQASDAEVAASVARFRPNMLCGWGSRLFQFALHIRRLRSEAAAPNTSRGPDLDHLDAVFAGADGVRRIMHGGEKLSRDKLLLMASVFGAAMGGVEFVSCYGSAETGVWSMTRPTTADKDGPPVFHVCPDGALVEILGDDGAPQAVGQEGEIVVTNLTRQLFPICRFRTGDTGRLLPDAGGCGRQLLQVLGRRDSVGQPLGAGFLAWGDLEREVVCGLAQDLQSATGQLPTTEAQLWLEQRHVVRQDESSGSAAAEEVEDTALLLVCVDRPQAVFLSDGGQRASESARARLRSFLSAKCGAGVVADVSIRLSNTMDNFKRSPRSSKLMRFVDLR